MPELAGKNVEMVITRDELTVIDIDCPNSSDPVIMRHPMSCVSFASGGDEVSSILIHLLTVNNDLRHSDFSSRTNRFAELEK